MVKFYTNVTTRGNDILERGYENGRAFFRRVKYKPRLYVPSQKPTEFKTMFGKHVAPVDFDSIREAKDFIEQYANVSNFHIYGMDRFQYAHINEAYTGEYDPKVIRVANIDIEVDSEKGFAKPENPYAEVIAITMKRSGMFYSWGLKPWSSSREDVVYVQCKHEKELLYKFLQKWAEEYPDVVTGWNINGYDIPYLVNRMNMILGKEETLRLSPWKFFQDRTFTYKGQERKSIAIGGISGLDYQEMYQKFVLEPRENYKLDTIASIELSEKKVDYSDLGNLHDLYTKDFDRFMRYNIHDVELVDKLDQKLQLINMLYALTYKAKVNYQDAYAQTRMWDVLIHNHLLKKNIVITTSFHGSKTEKFKGAFVKEPKIGGYEWVVSFDVASLYPSLIMQYNISPETIMEKFVPISIEEYMDASRSLPLIEGASLTANGWYYSNKFVGFMPEIVSEIFTERKAAKRIMLEAKKVGDSNLMSANKNKQSALKVLLNSLFGAAGNEHFRHYDLRLATSITLTGQAIIQWAETHVNDFMNKLAGTKEVNYIIAMDTDSLYIDFEAVVNSKFGHLSKEEIVDKLDMISSDLLGPHIEKILQKFCKHTNAHHAAAKMERDVIAERGIWTGKKRYALTVWDAEGVRAVGEPVLKIMGLEAIKSSTPSSCRESLTECIRLAMRGTQQDLQDYVGKFKERFMTLPFEEVAFPRGVQELSAYDLGDPSLPIHVRASLAYNKYLKDLHLTNRYRLIEDGDKIKFSYMRMPNLVGQNVIACPGGNLPKEFKLNKSIDYEMQFDKAFLQPLQAILDTISWKAEEESSLDEFFQ